MQSLMVYFMRCYWDDNMELYCALQLDINMALNKGSKTGNFGGVINGEVKV